MLSAISRLQSSGVVVQIAIPSKSMRNDSRVNEIEPWANSSPSENRMKNTLGGLGLSLLCEFDSEHKWLRESAMAKLRQDRGFWGNGQEQSYLEQIPNSASYDRRFSYDATSSRVRNIVDRHLRQLGETRNVNSEQIKSFAVQAWINAVQHGSTTEDNREIDSLRYISIRRTSLTPLSNHLGEAMKSRFTDYVNSLNRFVAGTKMENQFPLLELTISDGGIGVPGRMARNLEIYEDKYEYELDYFKRALRPDGSSRSPDEPGYGLGFKKMLRTTFNLNGMLVIRTGRILCTRSYLSDESTKKTDFMNPESTVFIPQFGDEPYPLIGGTSLSLFFPLLDSVQPRLF
jgi:hypothetical protein